MRQRAALVAGMLLILSACGQPPSSGQSPPTTLHPLSTIAAVPEAIDCQDIEVPHAPEDWYADTPIYVGNEMPSEEVRAFASGIEGFREVWIDRDRNGWIGVGFDGGDIHAHQEALEAAFPGVGVVAVEMPYSYEELQAISFDIAAQLPDGMSIGSIYEVQGYVEVFVGRLTEENIALASEAIADLPACITGNDPATTPAVGPQPAGGNGWLYLGEADAMLDIEMPQIIAEQAALNSIWGRLGIRDPAPEVDFDDQVTLVLVIGHSSSCPETRLDDVVVEGSLVYAVIPTITEEMACTADWVPRTYLVAVDRDRFPAPPFQISAEKDYGARVEVTADLRVPGLVPDEGQVAPTEIEQVREPTSRPFWVEPDFPQSAIVDVDCDVDYMGEISGVHWHRVEGTGMPEEWKAAAIEGLIDLELMMTPGPEPTLTASAGGVEILYLPGAEATYCP